MYFYRPVLYRLRWLASSPERQDFSDTVEKIDDSHLFSHLLRLCANNSPAALPQPDKQSGLWSAQCMFKSGEEWMDKLSTAADGHTVL